MKADKIMPEEEQLEKARSVAETSGPNCSSSSAEEERKEPAYFRRWWREYQQKMKASFGNAALKLQVEAQR